MSAVTVKKKQKYIVEVLVSGSSGNIRPMQITSEYVLKKKILDDLDEPAVIATCIPKKGNKTQAAKHGKTWTTGVQCDTVLTRAPAGPAQHRLGE
jgi:hypothetical protein